MNSTDVHVLSVGTALPGPAVDNATLTRRLGTPAVWADWIDSFIGTRTRHFSIDLETGEARSSLTDLCETAGGKALASAGLSAADVDLVILGTSSPDMLMPATVNMVADRLGIDDVPTYQMQSGCCGAVQALDVARKLLSAGNGRTALVLGGDNSVKHFDLTADFSALDPAEQVNVVIFGDGAGAAVLSTEPLPGAAVLRHVVLRLVGLNRPPGQIVEWFGRGDRNSDRTPIVEDYKAIEESVPRLAADVLDQVLDDLDWSEADIDYLLPPQLSGRMTETIVEALGVPGAQEVSCVAEIGNTGNALPFFQLERALPRMVAGDRAVGLAVESSKWIKAGYALEKV
ncbi:3-oxoacyl-ACP synthase III family protein [Actinocrispum wychmicini]|uniref:3-oxoacyl-[acyl-carrier-protein] synthase-3 n=1 Tax=Actinocrispum wychmicini TaxID=1213861 RepID=A0A4R2K3B7_9PSEU|nr:3-oxoacyl-ACP synthase III family protein [Actinocrispum wychmicini]TCO60795.1 3-oxoacyl-[acyl-carrier-protein] synthase-3 [Actinocrispum wychmicini]